MISTLLGLVLGGAALYQETNIVLPFSVGDKIEIRGYAFFQEIRQTDELLELSTVGRLEDPYEFAPSELHVAEVGIKSAHVDSAFYYSEIDLDGIGYFNYAGTRTRIDIALFKDFGVYAQSAQTLFRTTPIDDRANLTLGVKWKWIEADWTFGNIDPVQEDDPFFQAQGLHVRAVVRF